VSIVSENLEERGTIHGGHRDVQDDQVWNLVLDAKKSYTAIAGE
jgi:hypothetical protein